jgi:PAS domain S-box-containing protein
MSSRREGSSADAGLERDVQESGERFRSLAENARDLIYRYRLRPTPGFDYVSPAAAEMTGYTPEEHYADPDLGWKLVHPDDRHLLQAASTDAFVRAVELRWKRKDGTTLWTEQRNVPIFDADRALIAIEGIARDITQRKRLEIDQSFLAHAGEILVGSLDAATILEELAELTVQSMADCCLVVVAGPDGLRTDRMTCREPMKRQFAAPLEGVMLRPEQAHPALVVLQQRKALLVRQVSEDFLSSMAQTDEQLASLRGLAPASVLVVPLIAHDERLGALVLMRCDRLALYEPDDLPVADDLGRQTALALTNARLYESARRAVQARDETLSIIAHDLRSPLAAAHVSAATLFDGSNGDPIRACAERIQRSLNRANRLIDDLLDLAGIEAGKLSIDAQSISPPLLVREAVEALLPVAANASLDLRTTMPAGLPAVHADMFRVHQVLSNLIENAIKFTPAGGKIVVSAAEGRDEIRFAVADTGPGIAPEHLPHVFDRFWQQQTKTGRGAGLGLAIAKAIIDVHHGRIWMESGPEKGTTVHFTLPRA